MADMNQETIQQKIHVARRDAEALKDRIKRKKDELADTTRMLFFRPACEPHPQLSDS
jgi:guanine nucleotide-binding protein G(I)/G(S)/G(T) subunit beta-1